MEEGRLSEWTSIEELCDRYLHARPSPEALALLKSMETGAPELRALAERTLWLMKICRLDPSDISPAMAWWVAKLTPGMLPSALEGRVPSITMEGRHSRLDDYLAANPWTVLGAGSIVLDIGCGFPPRTTMDTAARFPAWQVIGVDHTFDDPNGATLFRDALKAYERANLSFIRANFGEDLPQADAVRCMNVLIYYGSDFRARAESWLAGILRPGGLFLCGANGWRSVESRYSVYRNEDGRLAPREFAFSLDNLRPFSGVPWFTLHDGERETWMLANMVGILRADENFRRDYDTSLDRWLKTSHILNRDSDGRLRTPPVPIPAPEWRAAYELILGRLEDAGFVDRAVSVLKAAGLRAWRNVAGHIAVEPLRN
jgi:SAM-dependent methyltransferase